MSKKSPAIRKPRVPDMSRPAPKGTSWLHSNPEFDRIVGMAHVRAANWRIAAVTSLIVNVILALGTVWIGSQDHVKPYILEVGADTGHVRVIGKVDDQVWEATDVMVRKALSDFITESRSISQDEGVFTERQGMALVHCTPQGRAHLEQVAQKDEPFVQFRQGVRRTVRMTDLVRVGQSGKVWRMEWVEETWEKHASAPSKTVYVGEFHVVTRRPTDLDELEANPLGVWVDFLDITEKRN